MKMTALLAALLLVQPPPPTLSPVKPKKGVEITSRDIPPVPPLTEITLKSTTTVPKEAIAFWFVFPTDKVHETISMDEKQTTILVRSDIPETTFNYFWVAKAPGKPQMTETGSFKAGKGPRPPPTPDPVDPDVPDPPKPPTPDPDAVKLPFPPSGFYCVFLRQDNPDFNSYTPVQKAAIGGSATAAYLNANATPGTDGQPGWRLFDVNSQFTGEGPWKEAHKRAVADMAAWSAKNPGKVAPWILVGNGTKGHSGPIDGESLDKTLELLRRYKG
jgi:hypothetical protein